MKVKLHRPPQTAIAKIDLKFQIVLSCNDTFFWAMPVLGRPYLVFLLFSLLLTFRVVFFLVLTPFHSFRLPAHFMGLTNLKLLGENLFHFVTMF